MSTICDPTQQIHSYIPATAYNLDCVSIEADLLSTKKLIVNGVDVSTFDLSTLLDKTQYQTATASPISTSFTGSVTITGGSLKTNNVTSCTVNSIAFTQYFQCSSTLVVNNPSTNGGNVATFLQGGLLTGNNVSLLLGASNVTNSAATLQYAYATSGSATANTLTIKMVGGTSSLVMNGSFNTISGDLLQGTRVINPRTSFAFYTFANNSTSSTFDWSAFTNVCRITISFIDCVRVSPANSDAVVQFGYKPTNTFYTNNAGSYNGLTSSYQTSIPVTTIWGASGIKLLGSWPTGGGYGTFKFSGKIIMSYFGSIGGVDYWTIWGNLGSPDIVNVAGTNYGPYFVRYCGYFKAVSGLTPISLMRVTTITTSETFQSGSINVTIE